MRSKAIGIPPDGSENAGRRATDARQVWLDPHRRPGRPPEERSHEPACDSRGWG
jgi:hypothetical protein